MKSHQFADIENRLRDLFPADLTGGVYIVDQATAGRDFVPCGDNSGRGVAAYTSDTLDVLLQPLLESEGRWIGRGLAMVVWPEHHHNERALLATAAHEFAHFAASDNEFRDAAPEALPDSLRFGTVRQWSADQEERRAAASVPQVPWALHGARFTRAAIHAGWRAAKQNLIADPSQVCMAGLCFGLSPWFSYRAALGSEMDDRQAESIRSILSDEPPDEFSALFTADTARYRRFDRLARSGPWQSRALLFDFWKQIESESEPAPVESSSPATIAFPLPVALAVDLAASPSP